MGDNNIIMPEAQQNGITNKSIAKNSIFFLLYNLLNILFPFVSGIYVAHILSANLIGQVAYAQNISQYFVILAFLGIPTYALREISKVRNEKDELSKLYTELFVINLISTFIFSISYLILILSVGALRENFNLYFITGLAILLNAMDISWLYEGLEEFKFISIRNVIFKIIAFGLLIAFVRGPDDYIIYAAITIIGTAGNNVINMVFAKKFIRYRIKNLNLKRHLKPIFLLVVANIAIEIYTLVDTTILGIFCNDDIVAFYTYGSRINRIFLQLINTFTIVIVPRLVFARKQERYDIYNDLLTKTLKIIIILAIPLIIGIQFVSEFFICNVYGYTFINSSIVLRILSPILLIAPIGYLLGSRVMLAVEKEWKMIICVGVGAIVNVFANIILIQIMNEYGAALASVIAELVVTVTYISLSYKYFKLNRIWDTILKVVAATGIMALYLYCCSFILLNGWIVFFIKVVGAVVLYGICLICMREKAVVSMLTNITKKLGFSRKK